MSDLVALSETNLWRRYQADDQRDRIEGGKGEDRLLQPYRVTDC